ncbi:unannotated protein [freshwater metagenome]|uniref:Unannotated protein n=1 Tax=freshwater metagenome TaxID=449393 RepID=A0A6J7XRS4_9ZZZZ|nr:alpha/beta fold hydrolase [Actinomycetota bacterium]
MLGILSLKDGRTLQWADNGIDSDSALIFHHGTTIALDVWQSWLDDAASHNKRAIAVNRPGIGQSSRFQGRRIIDDVSDTRELLEHLKIKSFVSIGWSGGGARALGTGLIQGCIAVHTIAGISPINFDDAESITWLSPERGSKIENFLQDFGAILEDRRIQYEEDLAVTHESLLEIISGLPNFELHHDRYLKFSHDLFNAIAPTLVNGPETDCDDYLANISSWGFTLLEVNVPVTLWHGEIDEDVVLDRGKFLNSQLPQSKLNTFDDQGHVTIVLEKRDEILTAAIQALENI